MSAVIHVVAAVIRGREGKVLLAKRPAHLHQGGKWEFPGGKLEVGESAEQALARELKEELGITPVVSRPLIQVLHDYPEKSVFLDVWEVVAFSGQPVGREGQQVEWVTLDALGEYEFPPANVPIITAAQLPSTILITPEPADMPVDAFFAHLEASLEAGVGWVILRSKKLGAEDFQDLTDSVAEICEEFEVPLSLNGPEDAAFPEGVGLHLTEAQLTLYDGDYQGWVSASCHSPAALRLAEEKGVDFVLLSPVLPTASHPEAVTLGWETFAAWVQPCLLPVFALGGVGNAEVMQAKRCGAQGVAGIRGFWK